jgi:DNA-binding transcriptional regulator LsrR (DeoR family)
MAKEGEELLAEIRAVKMLLILQLLRSGVRQTQIAAMLGISEATMSRMVPKGLTKGLSKTPTPAGTEGAE